jgi:Tol biopolymer transport system component
MRSCADVGLVALFLGVAAGSGRIEPPLTAAQRGEPRAFTVAQVLSLPTPDNLIASPSGSRIAWTFNERGIRNIYLAEAPNFTPRRLTPYADDDGQELTQLSFSPDGETILFVRGGDHGSNRPGDGGSPNPAANPIQPKIQVWSVPVAGGSPRLVGDGDSPAPSPDGRRVAFVRERRMWIAPLDGSKRPEEAFFSRGSSESPVWSPDGRTLAFVSNRGDHSFIGLFTLGRPIRYLAPSTSRDSSPIWSADGTKIAFVRQPGIGGAPRSPLIQAPQPWAILVAETQTRGRTSNGESLSAETVWTSGEPVDPILQNPGGISLRWAADDTLVFLSYRDGWPHLYSLRVAPGQRHPPMLLTPGAFMVEQFALTPDRRSVIYNANTGAERGDVDRRHLFKVAIDAARPLRLTMGLGIEWSPVVTADGQTIAYLSADAKRPPLPTVLPAAGGSPRLLADDHVPPDFPIALLATPEQVSFRAADGVEARGQLFKPGGGNDRRPAIVYVHGGGPRQMLLGWHYRWDTRTTTASISTSPAAASWCSQ